VIVSDDISALSKEYALLSDKELLQRHASGEITDIAYLILEGEIAKRGIAVPRRPNKSARKFPFHTYWRGQENLASAYWFLWVLWGGVFAFLHELSEMRGWADVSAVLKYLHLAVMIFAGIAVWRCSWNVEWKGWGYLARISVVSALMGLILPLLFRM